LNFDECYDTRNCPGDCDECKIWQDLMAEVGDITPDDVGWGIRSIREDE